jgi:hypothetical protein
LLDELNRIHSSESINSAELTPVSIGLQSASDKNSNVMEIPTLPMERLEINTPSFLMEKSERTVVEDRSFIKEPLGHLHTNPDVNRRKKKLKVP